MSAAQDASDSFSRQVTQGWGDAAVGGSYTISGNAAAFNVDGSIGTISMPKLDVPYSAYLRNVSALHVDIMFRVQTDKLAEGGGQIPCFISRYVSNGTSYVGRLRLAKDHNVYVQAMLDLNGTPTLLGGEKAITGITHSAGQFIWLRGQVVGTNPTIIRLKAWADGQPEPNRWNYQVTDSTPILQAPGSVGLRTYLSSNVTNAPILFQFDDFRATSIAEPDLNTSTSMVGPVEHVFAQ
jgi:hypothetical protein